MARDSGRIHVCLERFDADALDDLVYLRNGMAYIRRNTGGALGAEQLVVLEEEVVVLVIPREMILRAVMLEIILQELLATIL